MQTEDSVGVADYLAVLHSRRFLAIAIATPIVLFGVVLALALPDVYRSSARFRTASSGIDAVEPGRTELFDQYVMGLADKLLSAETLVPIVRDVDPYPELDGNEFAAAANLRSHIAVDMIQQTVLEPGSGRERTVNTGFLVGVDHPSPEKAAALAGRLTSIFVEQGRADLLDAASNRQTFFAGEAERLRKQIADLEQQLADFKSKNFGRLPESVQANVAGRGRMEQELDGVEREIRTLQQNRIYLAQQLRQAEAGPVSPVSLQQLEAEYARKAAVYAENHPDLIALRRQIDNMRQSGTPSSADPLQAQLEAQRAALAEARQRYSEDHPDVRRMVRDLDALEARIAAGQAAVTTVDTPVVSQLRAQLNSADTQIAGLQTRSAQLRAKLAQLDSQLGATPEVERGYQSLTRGLDTARSQFNEMISRKMNAEVEIAAITSGSADRFKLVAEPTVPGEPTGPKRLGIFVVSLIASVVLSLGAVILAELLDPRIRGVRDIRNVLGTTPLAAVPVIRNSVYQQAVRRRLVAAAGAVLVGMPIVFLAVRLMVD